MKLSKHLVVWSSQNPLSRWSQSSSRLAMFAAESDIKKRLIGGESAGVRNDPNGVNDLADKQFVDSKSDWGHWLQESSDDRGVHPHATILASIAKPHLLQAGFAIDTLPFSQYGHPSLSSISLICSPNS